MNPPSKPSAPQPGPETQRGPVEQPGPETQHGPETQRRPDAQHGPEDLNAPDTQHRQDAQSLPDPQGVPDPTLPLRGTSGKTAPKRLVKPAEPAHLPKLTPRRKPKQGPAGKPPELHRGGTAPDRSEGVSDPAATGTVDPPRSPRSGRAAIPVRLIRRVAVSAATAGTVWFTALTVSADNESAAASLQGALDPTGSLLAPAAMVWWLWLPIVAGWLAYAVYQWLPRQRTNSRHDWFGWLVLAAELVAFGWLLAVSAGTAAGLLAVAVAQVALGLLCIHRSNSIPPATRTEGWVTDVPLGLFFAAGIFSLTTSAAHLLTSTNADLAGWGGVAWALIGLVTVTMGVIVVCMTDRGHLAVAVAAAWGLSCVAVERLTGTPGSMVIGAAAAGSAFLVLLSAGSRRHQVDHERRWNERHPQQEQEAEPPAEEEA